MPNRNIVGDYRYAYQGQEKDPETGKEAFELRLWDGRIGRWLTVDPAGEFFSPYLGMGNNPISLTDPDGGSTSEGKCPPDCGPNLPLGATPLIGENGFVNDTGFGVQQLDEVVVTGYKPVNVKGNNHQLIFDQMLDNLTNHIKRRNENIVSGEIINPRPRITDFVQRDFDASVGWKMTEADLNINNTDVYIQARFPNAATRPKKPEPQIMGLETRARKRGTIQHSVYAYEIYLFTESINKSGHDRTFIKKPEALIIGFYNKELFSETVKSLNNSGKN